MFCGHRKKISKVVKLCKNLKSVPRPIRDAHLARRKPSRKQNATPNSSLLLIRARYYNSQLGQFISRDPLGYVDGMSQYRAYFAPDGWDPTGQDVIAVEPKGGSLKKTGCGGKIRKFHQIWAFKVSKQKEPGWVVQKVTVIANKAKCIDSDPKIVRS